MTTAGILDPRVHLKILGVIYMAVGGFIAAFALLAVVMGVMTYFGVGGELSHTSFSDAMTIFLVLIYPAVWVIQTGWGMYTASRSARMWGLIMGSLMFIGLNVMLITLNDRTNDTGMGFLVFHVLMILIGVYTLLVLGPKQVIEYLK